MALRSLRLGVPGGLAAAVAFAAGTVGVPTPAIAQDALGTGRALDANPLVGSGGVNRPARNFAAEVQLRNALVTGNAPGFGYFRGDLGYSGEFDFRAGEGFTGAIGGGDAENDIFGFERRSFSAAATRGVRGIDALRMQMGLTSTVDPTGEQVLLRRNAAGGADELVSQPGSGVTQPTGRNIFSQLNGSLRSTSGYLARESERPDVLGARRDEAGNVLASVASPLGGVRDLPASNRALVGPIEGFEIEFGVPSLMQGGSGLGEPGEAGVDPFDLSPEAMAERARLAREESFDIGDEDGPRGVNQPVGERAVDGPVAERVGGPLTNDRGQRFGLVRAMRADAITLGLASEDDGADATAGSTDAATRRVDELMRRLGESIASVELLAEERAAEAAAETAEEDAEAEAEAREEELATAVELIRRNRTNVTTLLPGEESASPVFAEHMAQGERWLAEGRWFNAEERFVAAMSIERGSVEADVGRTIAQLGAGLYASAALNLRLLFTTYPEVAGLKYSDRLLPDAERTREIVTTLRSRAEEPSSRGADAALLLAFIGYQTDRPEDVAFGLDRIDEITDEGEGDGGRDALADLLRRVWRD